MAQEDNNKKTASNSNLQRERQAHWRRHLDSSVVDLRNASASKEEKKPIEISSKREQKEEDYVDNSETLKDDGRVMRDIGSYREAGSANYNKSFKTPSVENDFSRSFDDKSAPLRDYSGDRDMPVAYLAKEEYVNQYIEELKRYSTKEQVKEMDDERIKRELFEQLSSIDSQDLKIQEGFPKAPPGKAPELAGAQQTATPSETLEREDGLSESGVSKSFQLIPREPSGAEVNVPQKGSSTENVSEHDDLDLDNFIQEDGTTVKDREINNIKDDDNTQSESGKYATPDLENDNPETKQKTNKKLFRARKEKRLSRKERKRILKEPSANKASENADNKHEEAVQALHASMQGRETPAPFGDALARFAESNNIEIEERIPSRYKNNNSKEEKKETQSQEGNASRFLSRIEGEGLHSTATTEEELAEPEAETGAKASSAQESLPEEKPLANEEATGVDNTQEESKEEAAEPKEEKPLVLDLSHAHDGEESSSSAGKSPLFQKKRNKKKKFIFAALILCLVIAPSVVFGKLVAIKNEGQVNAERAYSYMKEGQEALFIFDVESAEESFFMAMNEFSELEKNFQIAGRDILSIAARFPIQTSASSNARLVHAGSLISEAGYEISVMLRSFQEVSPTEIEEDRQKLTDTLITAGAKIKRINELMTQANRNLSYVRPEDIPHEFRDELLAAQSYAHTIEDYFEEALAHLDVLLVFLGHAESKNYLLAFQNSSELRPTGGFIGTYGLIKMRKGNMEELFIDGIYNPDGQLVDNNILIVPPKPMQYVSPNWGTRDANWFLDFPKSAEKIIEIYQKTGGPPLGETENFEGGDFNIDGVIALNINMLTRLLELSGPIDMPEYGVVLNSENWLPLVQEEVEENYDRDLNRPKQILADMSPLLMEKLSEKENKVELIKIFFEGLEQKDILVYSRDSEVQDVVLNRNWAGAMPASSNPDGPEPQNSDNSIEDYMAVAISNLGGWKTDLYTDTEIDTTTEFTEDGDIIRKVIIARRHNGGNTPYTWYNEPNHGYIKLYAPPGSELISAQGFSEEPQYAQINHEREGYAEDSDIAAINSTMQRGESETDIFKESGYTVFGNWFNIPAQSREVMSFTYKLSQNTTQAEKYRLYIQKQSGLDAAYSGSIENSHASMNIRSCSAAGESLQGRQFGFVQLNDKEITCRLDY